MRISTAEVPAGERQRYWQTAIDEAFVPLEFVPATDGSGFRAELVAREVDGLHFARLRSDPHTVTRTGRSIRRGGADVLFVMVPRCGHVSVRQDGRTAELDPGDLAIYDPARPCSIAAERFFDMSIARVPVGSFAEYGLPRPDARCTAVRVARTSDLGCLTAPYLTRMSDLPSSTTTLGVRGATMELLSAALASVSTAAPACPAQELRLQAQRLIRAQLGDPDLSPASLCAALHVSLRTLQLAFADAGTSPARWITDCRVQRAADLLRQPATGQLSITDVAFAVGFRDSSHFSRVFRRVRQESPREFRDRHRLH